jgi:hypothetical protein
MEHAGQVTQGMTHPTMLNETFEILPEFKACLKGLGGKFPAVSNAGSDGEDLKRSCWGDGGGYFELLVFLLDFGHRKGLLWF